MSSQEKLAKIKDQVAKLKQQVPSVADLVRKAKAALPSVTAPILKAKQMLETGGAGSPDPVQQDLSSLQQDIDDLSQGLPDVGSIQNSATRARWLLDSKA